MFRQKRKFLLWQPPPHLFHNPGVPFSTLSVRFLMKLQEGNSMTRPMIQRALLLAAFSSLALPAAASSDDAWKEFVADVQTACLSASKDMIEDAKVVVDPVGSENYGLAILTGKAKGADATISHICVYDKKTKAVELGSELAGDTLKVEIPGSTKP
jgi:hypothetical protein